jgi:hypothetical protein
MAQAIEHLLCKCEALSSKPFPPKKKKNYPDNIVRLYLKRKMKKKFID